MLNDKQCKYLTELLGECWHDEKDAPEIEIGGKNPICPKCNKSLWTAYEYNRTFTTWQDFGDVVRVLDDEKYYYDAIEYVMDYYRKCSMFSIMKQPDFVERFMIEVGKMRGVE
jgi:hypothetical protein